MAEFNLMRILLYTDGTVHFALHDSRCFYATPYALCRFFQEPVKFIKNIEDEQESTSNINHKKRKLEDIPGLTLAQYSSNGRLVCHFSELFAYIFSYMDNEDMKHKPLNMTTYIQNKKMPSSKSFLLKYFLDFTSSFDKKTKILPGNKLELDEEVLFSILRETFNSVLSIEPMKPKKRNLDDRLSDVLQEQVFITPDLDGYGDRVPVSEYAALHEVPHDEVLRLIKKGKFTTAIQLDNGRYLISRTEPLPFTNRKTSKPKKQDNTQANSDELELSLEDNRSWSHAEIENYCKKTKCFSKAIYRYIYTREELFYYIKAGFYEVDFPKSPRETMRCLIKDIDINLKGDDGRTNLERMADGDGPVEWDEEKLKFVTWPVHHIGQRSSCYCTLQPSIHSKFHHIFHTSAPDKDLHGPDFVKDKEIFWKWIAAQYKTYKTFDKIPHVYPLKNQKK